jgi:hypothetical protein
MDSAIQTVGLSKQYGKKWASRGVEIEVPRKSIYGFWVQMVLVKQLQSDVFNIF